MKILQLSTGHLGGAGLAARRLNSGLVEAGIDSTFVSLENDNFLVERQEYAVRRSIAHRVVGGALASLQRNFSSRILFSSFSLTSLVAKDLIQISPPGETIIHIHNWQNLINEQLIQDLIDLGYKIVFTLHDQRTFTGGCHYSFDCKGFVDECRSCPLIPVIINSIPRYVVKRSPLMGLPASNIRLIGPSNWILKLAAESRLLSGFTSVTISNVLGSSWREMVSLIKFQKNSVFTVGVASMDPSSYVKGGDILEILESEIRETDFSIVRLSDFKEGREADFWGQIDCLLVPSRIDNSPNVIHEGKSLGIPIIGSNVGGISEILDENDFLFDPYCVTPMDLLGIIQSLKENPRGRLNDAKHYLPKIISRDSEIIQEHIRLYSSLLSGDNPAL